ncbi:magnesium transporter CorA family protein [Zavarzinia sp. CC-PAN008]|uniref:magnesium transporter CorA family protein n=1 Tax=Zavarzinia sp. CC-PAN008 TaxID=3243332 RepID=UPI003F74502B
MMTVYASSADRLERLSWAAERPLPEGAVWIDLLQPTQAEEEAIEHAFQVDLPTRAKMQEIEMSSRLYQVDRIRYMAANVMSRADQPQAESEVIAFVLVPGVLITLRYSDPAAFTLFSARALRQRELCATAEVALAGLLEAIVDRAADVLEIQSSDLDRVSRAVFSRRATEARQGYQTVDLEDVLLRLGQIDDHTTKVQESIASLSRLLTFMGQAIVIETKKDYRARIKTLTRDAQSIGEHAKSLTDKSQFLLDATLGLINIQQTKIIKIFSVASTVFPAPTLIASIYGMNFQHMPELDWRFGYPLVILMMITSAVLPYLYFKRKGWL